MKKRILPLFLLSYIAIYAQLDANSLMGIPTESTVSNMNSITGANEGSILYNLEDKKIYVYNGSTWVSTSNDNWLIDGNTGLDSSSFLGHTDDVKMEIRSDNLPILQFGRRNTLGLTQTYLDYTDDDQALVYVNGNGATSALQFAASGAAFYKPMFFTTTNGNFRLKGSSGVTDLFEIGSAGPANDGRLEFIIGDDGSEPIIFKRYDYRNSEFHTEFFRVQGSNNTTTAKTRFGININPQAVPIDTDYNDPTTSFNVANSTLQLSGSLSKSVTTTTGNLTLTEDNYSVIISGAHTITLPDADTCLGREYVLKNTTGSNTNISNYLDSSNATTTSIQANSTLKIQSDGTNWHQINNFSSTSSGGSGSITTYIDKYNSTSSTLSVANFNTNGTLIPLNSVRVYAGSVANTTNDQVQITEAGLYEITYTVSLRKENDNDFNTGGGGGGGNNNSLEIVVCENNNPIANTGTIVTLIGNSNDRYVNASRTVLLNLSAYQSYGIKIREKDIANTGDVIIDNNATGMTIKKIN